MTTSTDMLNNARGSLGIVEDPPRSNHNVLTELFADISGWEWARSGDPWCDMSVSVWLTDAGIRTVYAYTPTHLNAFKSGEAGVYLGDRDAADVQPGDVVFYSFGGVRTDHVGVVEVAHSDGRLTTIEGNVGDAVRRQLRTRSSVTGFGRPAYDGVSAQPAPVPAPPPTAVVPPGRLLWDTLSSTATRTSHPHHTMIVQQVAGADADGVFGLLTAAAVAGFQRTWGLGADGVVGPKTGTAIVQNVLRDWGYGVTVDGDFGPQTTRAVRAFQSDQGLEIDGLFGDGSTLAMHARMGLPAVD